MHLEQFAPRTPRLDLWIRREAADPSRSILCPASRHGNPSPLCGLRGRFVGAGERGKRLAAAEVTI